MKLTTQSLTRNLPIDHYKLSPYLLKSDARGEFRGYASVFNVRDSYGDIIKPHAFQTSLQRKSNLALLWQHQAHEPIGIINQLYEDRIGLVIQGQLLLNLAKAQEAYTLLAHKVISGLSIGFRILQAHQQTQPITARIITEIELIEISVVTFPANPYAKILDFKSAS